MEFEKYTDAELNEKLNLTIALNQKEFDPLDWYEELLIPDVSKKTLMDNYTHTIATHFHYLRLKERNQQYELCQKIMTCILIEEENFIHTAQSFTNWYDEQAHYEIKNIRTEFNDFIV